MGCNLASINNGGQLKYPVERLKHIHRADCLNFEQFDKDYNVDTASPIIQAEDNELEMRPWWEDNSSIIFGSEGYQPTPLYWLDIINEYFSSKNISNFSFVDIGAGKGKVILYNLLKNMGYKDYIAIEADKKYLDIFNNNINQTSIAVNKPVKSILINALDYDYSKDNQIYFLFQPFDEDTMRVFIDKHFETIKKTNSYIVFVVINKTRQPKLSNVHPVFEEGFVSIYNFSQGGL